MVSNVLFGMLLYFIFVVVPLIVIFLYVVYGEKRKDQQWRNIYDVEERYRSNDKEIASLKALIKVLDDENSTEEEKEVSKKKYKEEQRIARELDAPALVAFAAMCRKDVRYPSLK